MEKLKIKPSVNKNVPFDVSVLDFDSESGEADSEYVWSGSQFEPEDEKGFGILTLISQ